MVGLNLLASLPADDTLVKMNTVKVNTCSLHKGLWHFYASVAAQFECMPAAR